MAKKSRLNFPFDLADQIEKGVNYVAFKTIHLNNPEAGEMCFMYMPKGLSVTDGASYSGVDLGVNKTMKALGAELGVGGAKKLETEDAMVGMLSMAKKMGGTAEAGATEKMMALGVAANPFTNMAFDSMAIRTFGFDFQLISESADEAKEAKDIENWFRKNMYAAKAGQLTVKYPPKFRIIFMMGEERNKFLPFIQDCYCTGLDSTYNDSGNMFHADGSPVEQSIKLSFTEAKVLTQDDLYTPGSESLEYHYRYSKSDADSSAANALMDEGSS
jgi:hypothetical protein